MLVFSFVIFDERQKGKHKRQDQRSIESAVNLSKFRVYAKGEVSECEN